MKVIRFNKTLLNFKCPLLKQKLKMEHLVIQFKFNIHIGDKHNLPRLACH
jgi:hypothetical protein